jgi:hypothetical protein
MPKPENIIGKGFDKRPQNINRKGRPKLPDIREAMAKVLADEKDGMQALEAVLKALRAKAVKGDVRAAEVLLDRAFGKATQQINANIKTETPIFTPIDLDVPD